LKRELNIHEIALMTTDPAIAHPKLSMENPPTSDAENWSRKALMTRRKSPRVTMIKGIEKKTSIGLTIALMRPRTSATRIAAPKLLI